MLVLRFDSIEAKNMVQHRSKPGAEGELPLRAVPWESLENQTTSTFTLAGVLLTASLFLPVVLATITEWAWVSGVVLVGLGVMSVVGGLLGLYLVVNEDYPRLATVGVLSTVVAGLAALGLLAMGGFAFVGGAVLGMELGTPMGLFSVVAISMAGGFAVAFLSFGFPVWRTKRPSRAAGLFLLFAGGLLLVTIAGELVRIGFGIGPPSWLVLLVVGLVSLSTLGVGISLRQGAEHSESSGE